MKDRGFTVDDLKRDLRRQLSIQKLINKEVVAKVTITDQDVTDFYNQNRSQFNVAEPQYRIAQIVVTPRKDPLLRNRKNDDATTEAEARHKCATLLERLAGGADFATLAMDYSEHPTTATTRRDRYSSRPGNCRPCRALRKKNESGDRTGSVPNSVGCSCCFLGVLQVMTTRTSPALTAWPSLISIRSTLPVFGARISFCIF